MKPLSRTLYQNTGIKHETLLMSIIPQYSNQIQNSPHEHYTTIHNQIGNPSHEHYTTIQELNMKPLSRTLYQNTGIKHETLLMSTIPQYSNQIQNSSHERYTTIQESNTKPLSRALYHDTGIKYETPLTNIIPQDRN